jgi:sodium/proline symporter
MNWIAISFGIYTLAVMAFGIYSARLGKSTSSDFFLADRGLGAWVSALSGAASAESGWVTLGLVGIAYETGVGALWIVPGTVAAFLFLWLIQANPLRRLSTQTDSITLPDVLAANFDARLAFWIRLVSVVVILAMLTTYVAAQLAAAGKAFVATFDWDYRVGVGIGAAIVLIYTMIGGFRAVAWTDVVQAALMVTAVIVLPVVMISDLGGPAELWHRLKAIEPMTDPWGGKTGLAFLGFLSVWIGVPLGYPGQPHVLMRLMAAKDETAVRRAALISSCWVFVLFMGAISVGIAARVVFPEIEDPERSLPHAALYYLPAPMAGMVVAAMVAAICSTADSQLLVCASALAHDVYVKLCGRQLDERLLSWINRCGVLIIGVIASLIAAKEVRLIFDFVLAAWDSLGAAFGPALILKLLWKRTTGWGVLMGILVGFLTAIIWRRTLHPYLYTLIPAFTFSFVTVVLVSWMTSKKV